jgi:RecB family exonuclease
MANKTVSYSQFSLYANCPKRWKLDYLDGLRTYEQNINTCFGSAFHKTLQNYLHILYNDSAKQADSMDLGENLKQAIFEEYKESLTKNGNKHYSTPQELSEFYLDGEAILKYFKSHRRAYFTTKQHALVGIEVPLEMPLINNVTFNGFIDVVIKDEKNNRIKIYDIKTSTQGWNKYQKADITKTAQLILYKEFYGKQFNVDPEDVDVEYLIVRRKINENSEFPLKRIQTFEPASGKPTRNKVGKLFMEFVQNCFTEDGTYNHAGNFPAITSSACNYCPYKNEEVLCPKKERLKKEK